VLSWAPSRQTLRLPRLRMDASIFLPACSGLLDSLKFRNCVLAVICYPDIGPVERDFRAAGTTRVIPRTKAALKQRTCLFIDRILPFEIRLSLGKLAKDLLGLAFPAAMEPDSDLQFTFCSRYFFLP
jgi:hypothetical protein